MKHIISLNTSGSTSLISTRFWQERKKKKKEDLHGGISRTHLPCDFSNWVRNNMPLKHTESKTLSNWGQMLRDSKRATLHVWGKLGFLWDVWGCWENCIWDQAAQQVWEWQQATHTTHGFGQSGDTMDASPRDEEICHCSHLKSL